MTTINYRDAAATMRAALGREEDRYREAIAARDDQKRDKALKRVRALRQALKGAK